VKSAETMSVEIQRKIGEIMRKRGRDDSDFQMRIVVHPVVFDRLRKVDDKLIIDLEKKYFVKFAIKPDPALHAEAFKLINGITNEELASVG
jgi:Ribonuclease G/E